MIVIKDRIKEYTSTAGLGSIQLEGAESGFLSFSSVCNELDIVYYCITHQNNLEWELGKGIFSNNEIIRDQVFESSNDSDYVDFTQGGKEIFLTHPSKLLDLVTRISGPALLGRSESNEGLVEQLTISQIKSMLNLSSSDISNFISTSINNRAVNNSGVFVPELSIDLKTIYNNNK